MKKRIRKKIEKRMAAEREAHGVTLSAIEQLRAALEDLRHSAAYLLDTALSEVQESAATMAHELRARAEHFLAALGQPLAAGGVTERTTRSELLS